MNIENHIVTMDGSGLSEAFWDTFVRDYWGKRPVLFKNVFATPFCPPSRLFETFLVAAERRAKTRGALSRSRKRPRLDFYGDGFNMQVLEDHAALLPTREDESFERYQERVERQLGTQQLLFNLAECCGEGF